MVAAGGREKAERGVVAQSGVDGERWRDAPGIFGIETEAAERLREGAIASGRVRAGRIWKSGRGAIEIGRELRGIIEIERRILRELYEMLGGTGERAAENGFVDQIDAETKYVAAGGMKNVVAELIFLLVAFNGKSGDFRGELIVAESFESRGGVEICAERESQREAEIGVTSFGVMKIAGFESERAEPVRRKTILLGDKDVVVVRSGG